jgi:superfamily II DNA or RNA helicase
MSLYFRESHPAICIKQALDQNPGLRISQIGAIHAIGAHFSLRSDPALVVLPTGTGKTAVLMLTPYLLVSTRVLIIAQSRFVRDQIARDFAGIRTLKGKPPDFP